MNFVLFSVLPIFFLIASGYLIKNYMVPDEGYWKNADKLTYYVFFPSILILKVSEASFSGVEVSLALGATILATCLIATLCFVSLFVFKIKHDLFTSIFQGGVRYNSYIFIALASALFDSNGVAISGIFIAYMIIITNIMSVLVMNKYGNGNKKGLGGAFLSLAQNPLIAGAMFGLVLNLLSWHISGPLHGYMTYLGEAATSLSLLSVGAGLNLWMHAHKVRATLYAASLKLLVMPLTTLFFLKLSGVGGLPAQVALAYASVPCAGNAYILARQMGGDTEAMAAIISWSTLLSIITMTLILGMALA